MALNHIVVSGRLCADPEMRTTPAGVPVVTLRLAVERDVKDKATGKKGVDFIPVVAWRNTAEYVSRYFTKGRVAIVEGRLQIRQYTGNDGVQKTTAEIIANQVYFGDTKPQAEPTAAYTEITEDDSDLPF